jgi:hypothetical protein
MDVKVGDMIMVSRSNQRGMEVALVTSVGRKLITVERQRCKFYRENGSNNTDYTYPYVQTVEHYKEDNKRAVLWSALREHGLECKFGYQADFHSDTLEQILAVITVG